MRETESAIEKMLLPKHEDAEQRARRAVENMKSAFPEAKVIEFQRFENIAKLPDPNDHHVLAAAVKTRASMLVTENVKDFPKEILNPLNIEVKTADEFIADAVELDMGLALGAIRKMRNRFERPELTPEEMLSRMERAGLTTTASVLRPVVSLL